MFCFSKAALLPLSALAAAWSLAGLTFVHAPAHAQAQPPAAQRADPADPNAVVPATAYRSSLSRYQAFTAPDVAPWRDTNAVVHQRGGWRAYARESQEPPSTAVPPPTEPSASKPAAPVRPAMPGHAGHEMK